MGTPSNNKGYTIPTLNGDFNVWGNEMNGNLGILDNNLGGQNTITSTGGSINVTTIQAQSLIQTVTGTLASDGTYTLPAGGAFYIVDNETSGAHALNVTTGIGTSITVPQGKRLIAAVDQAGNVFSATDAYLTNGGTIGSFTSTGTLIGNAISADLVSVVDPSHGGIIVNGTANASTGANIELIGNGATAPNKYIRAFGGVLDVVNSAYTTPIFTIADNGNVTTYGTATINGAMTVGGAATIGGNLTVSGSAFVPTVSTSDNSTAAANTSWVRSAMSNIAGAAGFSVNLSTTGHIKFPSWLGGWIVNWGQAVYTSNGGGQSFIIGVDFPYPNNHLWAMGSIGTGSLQAVSVGAAPNNGSSIAWGSVSTAGGLPVTGFWLSLGN